MILRYSCRIIATCGNCGNVLAIHRRYGQLDTGGCGDTLSVAPTMRCWSSAMSRPSVGSVPNRLRQASRACPPPGHAALWPGRRWPSCAYWLACLRAMLPPGIPLGLQPACTRPLPTPAPNLIVRFDDGQAQARPSHCAGNRSGSATDDPPVGFHRASASRQCWRCLCPSHKTDSPRLDTRPSTSPRSAADVPMHSSSMTSNGGLENRCSTNIKQRAESLRRDV